MTTGIAELLKANLAEFYGDGKIISHLFGMTKVYEFDDDGKTKKFPIPAKCVEPPDCVDCLKDQVIMPDENKRLMIYFEGTKAKVTLSVPQATRYESAISLICWYNESKFTEIPNLHQKLIQLFSGRMRNVTTKPYANETGYVGLEVDITNITSNDVSIFSLYTYSLANSPYLGCPFSAFKIELKTKYLVYENQCNLSDIVVNPDAPCA